MVCLCINSAIRSTIAFDRIGGTDSNPYIGYKPTRAHRLIATNIFGTVHAPFGNMLVLAAVYGSETYQPLLYNTLLNPSCLNALFQRTFEILQEYMPINPTLQIDF
ncbi:hypothetical protein GQ44DRAFT_711347 [Phaeosphaeriaceae sp. PMI808]|nr:hypothetical protein GQ44DRAFT_711347 [Phaeosphaeriaceae sp. PMI808]